MSTITQEDVISYIEGMSVLDLADLIKVLEDKFGVSAAAMAVAAAPAAGGGEAAAVEQTEFKVTLKSIGAQKIQVIKAVRALTGLGLKEAKELVDGAPGVVKDGIPKEEAEKVQKELTDAGAEVEIS